MTLKKVYIEAEWVKGILSPESVHKLNDNSYSVLLLREAKRLLEKQRKEHAPLIAKFERERLLKKRQHER